MAQPRLFSIKEIADTCGIPLVDFMIPCYYCSKWLTTHDKILYEHSGLHVVWKDELPSAACQPCIRASARFDFLFGFTRTLSYRQYREVFSYEWADVTVRCLICFRKLNVHEKNEIANRNLPLFVVKDALRAQCCLCKIGL